MAPTDPFQEQVAFLPMTFSQIPANTSRIFFYLLWKYKAFSFPILKYNFCEVCAICRMWPVSKLCPHFVFKRPRLNQIWPNFVFTAGFSTAGWPQNTDRLSLKEFRRLTPFELPLAFAPIIMSSSEPPELLLWDVLAVSSISLENDGVQNQNLKCLTSGNSWPSFEKHCLFDQETVGKVSNKNRNVDYCLLLGDQRHSLSKTNPDATNWGRSTGNWGASSWLAAKLISSAGSQSTSTDFHNCQISTKGENGPNRFFRDPSMAALLALFSGFSQALVGVILYCFTSLLSDLSLNVVYHCNFFARDLKRQSNWDLVGWRRGFEWWHETSRGGSGVLKDSNFILFSSSFLSPPYINNLDYSRLKNLRRCCPSKSLPLKIPATPLEVPGPMVLISLRK